MMCINPHGFWNKWRDSIGFVVTLLLMQAWKDKIIKNNSIFHVTIQLALNILLQHQLLCKLQMHPSWLKQNISTADFAEGYHLKMTKFFSKDQTLGLHAS